jgi:NAD(P)-dependent dehydrogenase (short-subunit alcohol dehydrogenase family)
MSSQRKTAIVTGASQGIGAGIVKAFVERGFNVVANSRKVTQSTEVTASDHVALVDGHIGEPATAARMIETALSRFKSIDVLVNNAGIFFTKPFTDVANGNHAMPERSHPGSGSAVMRPKTLLGSESHTGKIGRSLSHQ